MNNSTDGHKDVKFGQFPKEPETVILDSNFNFNE